MKNLISQAKQNLQSAGELWRGVNVLGCYQVRNSEVGFVLSLDSVNDFFRTVATTAGHQPASAFVPLESRQSDSNFTFCAISPSAVYIDFNISGKPVSTNILAYRLIWGKRLGKPMTSLGRAKSLK